MRWGAQVEKEKTNKTEKSVGLYWIGREIHEGRARQSREIENCSLCIFSNWLEAIHKNGKGERKIDR